MTEYQPSALDPGARCICGHPEHTARCSCGCRRYVSAGSHPDQSRGGAVPATVAVLGCAVVIVVLVAVIVVWALEWWSGY